ncbi:hypothetical protein EV175_002879 [Coemansia sp. RSA 1933]|nr:hypothetical protein EV175_002879 [Coemansia sp. RSA 1933]
MSIDPQSVPFLRSCERCRQKKRKCTGEKPSCSWCTNHSVPCKYRRTMRFKSQLKDCSPSSLDALRTPVLIAQSDKEQIQGSSSFPITDGWRSGGVPPDNSTKPNPLSAKPAITTTTTTPKVAVQNAPNILPNFALDPSLTDQQQPSGSGSIQPSQDGIFSAAALSRLLSVDMIPQSNPPANLLQAANSFMTPFATNTPFSRSEWTTATNTEADMLANLGDLATSWNVNSQNEWMPVGLDDLSLEFGSSDSMTQNFLNGELMFSLDTGSNLQDLPPPLLGLGNTAPSPSAPLPMPTSNVSPRNSVPTLPSAAHHLPKPLAKSQTVRPKHSPLSTEPFNAKDLMDSRRRTSAQYTVEMLSKQRDGGSVPKDYFHTNFGPPLPMSPIYSPFDTKPQLAKGGPSSQPQVNSLPPLSSLPHMAPGNTATNPIHPQGQSQQHIVNLASRSATASPGGSRHSTPSRSAKGSVSDGADIPPMLREYVALIPGNPSAEAVYKIMRETFKAPRMGMVSLNLELLWYMLHKGVLPRIAFFGHISSTVRFSVANLDIKSMVPPDIDESCYELALREVPLVKDCSELWGAIGLCMLARYEFQSLRYKEMDEHSSMAMEVMRRIKYMGHSYPWHGLEDKDKESFGFQYILVTFWKCFLWKLVSMMLIESDRNFNYSLDMVPTYSSKTFDLYTTSQAYDVDLMEMIPRNSWLGADSGPPPNLRFRGPNDEEFMRMRPEGSPCFNRRAVSAAYTQQLLVIFAGFNILISKAKRNEGGLENILKGLWIFKERMRAWRNSLPSDLVLDNGLVSEYLEAISPSSTASPRDIDVMASQLKDIIMMLMLYHTFLVRANRYVMKLMLGERIDLPPPDVSTAAFGIRDLYDCTTLPPMVSGGLGFMNMYFHGCRIQAITSANALCSLVQAAYACKFNFYTIGSPIIFTMFEVLVTYVSFLRSRDDSIRWRAKSRLSNVFNILRMLRHWAPALNLFVAGIKNLSDPHLCLEEPRNFQVFKRNVLDPAMMDMSESPVDSLGVSEDENRAPLSMLPPKRRRVVHLPQALESTNDARTNIMTSSAPPGTTQSRSDVKRDETLSYRAANPIPELPNPFPPKHIISLIIKDLDLSMAEFLAPAYPILLLRLTPAKSMFQQTSLAPSAGYNQLPNKY